MTRQEMARKRASMARSRRRSAPTVQGRRASASRMRNMAAMRNASGANTGFQKPSGDFANQSGNPQTDGRVSASLLMPFV